MDYDFVLNISNATIEDSISAEDNKKAIVREIIFTLFSLISLAADIVIVYIILRFPKLRTIPNTYIAHWAISDALTSLCIPSTFRIIAALEDTSISYVFLCILLECSSALYLVSIIFMASLAIDWCLSEFFPDKCEKLRKHYKIVVAAGWAACFGYFGLFTGYCLSDYYFPISHILVFFTYIIFLIFVLILQCIRAVRKCQRKPENQPTLMLTIVTILVVCVFVSSVFLVISQGIAIPFWVWVVVTLAECIWSSCSLIALLLLFKYNKDFQGYFIQTFKCSNYLDAEREFEPTEQNGEVQNSTPQVAFNNRTVSQIDYPHI